MDTENAVSVVPQSLKWYEILRETIIHPSVETFQHILSDPNASWKRIYWWMVVCYSIFAFLMILINASSFGQAFSFISIGYILMIFLGPLLNIVFLLIIAWIIHLIASRFGGTGKTKQLTYVFGILGALGSLLLVPLSILSVIISSTSGSNITASLFIVPLQLASSGYILFLLFQAIRAEENLGKGKAFLALIIPVSVFLVLGLTFNLLISGNLNKEKAPIEIVLDSYMKHMVAKETNSAYALFSPRSQRQISLENVEQLLEGNKYAIFEGYQRLSVGNIQIRSISSGTDPNAAQGTVALVVGNIFYAGGVQGVFSGILEKVNDKWQIYSINVQVPESKMK